MSRVCLYLPPFAGDYSGVCSALYDLGGMVCIHDAAGCTGNYTHFDEPRWYGGDAMVYCTSFRKLDAVLGNDERIMKRMETAAAELKPRFIAIVGSPVPNVIGFDFQGVANALGERTGLPVFGFATMGIRGSYKDGIVMAVKAVTERLAEGVRGAEAPGRQTRGDRAPLTVNLQGVTPLDLDQDIFDQLCRMLEAEGFCIRREKKNGHYLYGSWEQMTHPETAAVNLAWTQAGLELCRYFEKTTGKPYLAGLPIGEENRKRYFEALCRVIREGRSESFRVRPAEEAGENVSGTDPAGTGKAVSGSRVCILQDALIGSAMADLLWRKGRKSRVFSVTGRSEGMEVFADGALPDEDRIAACLRGTGPEGEDCGSFLADPIILHLLPEERKKSGIEVPHYAVSSRVGKDAHWDYLSETNWEQRLFQRRSI